ncbi:MAG: beta galactosidase jelly roll domain-containing protein [Bacteroidales bacterium]|nr:beta galactosidase jelly roll domain-containing protein [Bacteroidales bacterium]
MKKLISFNRIYFSLLFSISVLLLPNNLSAEDLRKVVQLAGYWKFSIGDFPEWAYPEYNDSGWENIKVPDKWENQGFNEYNGFAWYRKEFTIHPIDENVPIYFVSGRIDDANEIYFNGHLLAKSGDFPPHYRTAYNQKRKYHIPREIIKFNQKNFIAIRVYDEYLEGGIIDQPVGIYIDEDYEYLDFVLSDKWKFHLGDNKQWKSENFNDDTWEEINVPSEWENEGYEDYDGYAWYRKEFKLPPELRNGEIYLSLGKIDDYDYVYLNGTLIGSVFHLDKDGEYKRRGWEYNARRIYKIPENAIHKNGINVLSIRVYDVKWRGGIYEGPLGIMTEPNYKQYRRKHHENQSFWDYVIDELFID